MDRNTIVGFVLIAIILVAFSLYNAKSRKAFTEKQKQEQLAKRKDDSLAIAKKKAYVAVSAPDSVKIAKGDTTLSDSLKNAKTVSHYGEFHSASEGQQKLVTIENENLKIVLTNKGGKIESVEIKNYFTADHKPLILFEGSEQHFSYLIPIQDNKEINTEDFYFDTDGSDFSVTGNEEKSITFTLHGADGHAFAQTYTLKGNSYLVGYNLHLTGFNEVIPKTIGNFKLTWSRDVRQIEHSLTYEKQHSTLYYKTGEDIDYISYRKPGEEKLNDDLKWLSFKQQFFNESLITNKLSSAVNVNITSKPDSAIKYVRVMADGKLDSSQKMTYVKNMSAQIFIESKQSADLSFPMQFYFAPNRYNSLKDLNIGLEKIIPLGGGIFKFVKYINRWIIIPVFNLLEKATTNYALIILILTLMIKLILTPLTLRSSVAAAKMKVLKPEIDELKEKFKDDQQKLGVAQMELYKRAGVSPLGGCLPTLLQMPILVAMYYFFPASIELRQHGFLWVHDFATYDSIVNFGTKIPLLGDHLSLFTLLMTATSILSARMTTQIDTTGQMKFMQYFFPFFLMFLFNSFPAALTYYYFLQNVLSIGQQWLIKKYFIDEEAIHKQIQENKKKPIKKSSFAQRLENLQRQQQQNRKGKK